MARSILGLALFLALIQNSPPLVLRVEVTVVDSAGVPLPATRVGLLDTSYRTLATAQTGNNGIAVLQSIPVGTYRFHLEKSGYIYRALSVTSTETAPLTVEAGNVQKFRFRLQRPGSVSGRISDAEGALVPGVTVELLAVHYDFDAGHLENDPNLPPAKTNETGEFLITNVPPGDWYLRGSGNGLVTYFPGQLDASHALPIHVSDGEEMVAGSFHFGSPARFRISGSIVFPETGPPPSGVSVGSPLFYLVPRNPNYAHIVSPPPQLMNYAQQENRFELRNIAPGSYDLYVAIPQNQRVRANGNGPVRLSTTVDQASRIDVEIRDSDVNEVVLHLQSGIHISGQFVLDAASASRYPDLSKDFDIYFRNNDARPPMLGVRPDKPVGNISSDGHFGFRGVAPGSYHLVAAIPRDLYVAAARLGNRDVFGIPFEIGTEEEGPLILEVRGDGAEFSGTVNGVNSIVPSSQVLLVPPLQFRNDPESYRLARSDASGRFTIRGIRPGPYTVFALPQSFESYSWTNPAILSEIAPSGIAINFSANEHRQSELRLMPVN